jgi:hypothetical protein
VHPRSTGRWLAATITGAPTPRMLVVVPASSYHRQWSGTNFKIGGEEILFLFQLTGD